MVFCMSLLGSTITEINSNSAAATLFMPIMADLVSIELHIITLCVYNHQMEIGIIIMYTNA